MCSAGDNAALPALGFPIREPAGHRLFSASPRLIAAVHALHRLLVPRHPPRALTILTVIEPKWFGDNPLLIAIAREARPLWLLCSFQGSREACARRGGAWIAAYAKAPGSRRSLKTQQHAGLRSSASRCGASRVWRPARFGRRARPDGRSDGPEWAGGAAGAPYGAP